MATVLYFVYYMMRNVFLDVLRISIAADLGCFCIFVNSVMCSVILCSQLIYASFTTVFTAIHSCSVDALLCVSVIIAIFIQNTKVVTVNHFLNNTV